MRMTAENIVDEINRLSRDKFYSYIAPTTSTKIMIVDITRPEGPIRIKRFNPEQGQSPETATISSISANMIWRIANAISENQPINFDRILGASYNTRSALEALIAYTPQFYYCFPGRIETIKSSTKIKKGHKHLVWRPNNPHEIGIKKEIETDQVISEIPTSDAIYESLTIPDFQTLPDDMDIETKRRHSQIQIALMLIGRQLDNKIWIANNDKGIEYNGKTLGEYDGVISSLGDVQILESYNDAQRAAQLIDVIWFRNSLLMPGVFEIEHSTGVKPGLTRMKHFYDNFLRLEDTNYVIVAPDETRAKVLEFSNRPQFSDLNVKYFPYSGVDELYSLTQRRKLQGVDNKFFESFIERCVTN